jgi:hypothetical protein
VEGSFEADDTEHLFKREDIAFPGRDEQPQRAGGRRAAAIDQDGSSDEEQRQPQAPTVDSSDEDNGVGEAEHEGGAAATANVDVSEWSRDDDYGVDERCKHGFTDQYGPRLNNFISWETASLFSIALHFLPVAFLTVSRDTEKTTSPHLLLRRSKSQGMGKGTAKLAGSSY